METQQKELETLIEREFPNNHEQQYAHPSHKNSIINIIHYIAAGSGDSSIKNSRSNCLGKICSATLKTLWNVGLLVGTSWLIRNYGELAGEARFGTLLAAAFTAYQTKLNLLGKHVFTGAGTYYKSPYFSIIDELRFAKAWGKVAKYQKQGKLHAGNRDDISTDDCYLELGRNQIGGP